MTSQTEATTTTTTTEATSEVKPLPQGAELKAALAPYTVFAAPLVLATSKICEIAKTDPLSPKECEGGEMAFGAMLYQYGAQIDAKVLLLLWTIGISAPRILQVADRILTERKEKEKQP
jgi:hypothetical protein